MITLTPHMPLFVGIDPIDFRCGIDKLSIISESLSKYSALSGTVFVFSNRAKTAVKILVHDGVGFWLVQRRLAQGKLSWWPKHENEQVLIDHHTLSVILQGESPCLKRRGMWKRISGREEAEIALS